MNGRAYNFHDWFRAAYAPHVPEYVPTQARGALLASGNDEPEPKVAPKRLSPQMLRLRLFENARANGWGHFPNPKTGRMEWRCITEREALIYKRSRLGALSLGELARLAQIEWEV